MKFDSENPNIADSTENQNFNIQRKKRGEIAGGLILIILGTLWLLHELDFHIPKYIYSWSTVVLLWGIYRLIKFGLFDYWGYFLLVFAMINVVEVGIPIKQYFGPIAVIAGGVYIIIKLFRNNKN